MTDKSYTNTVYYLLIKFYYHQDITVTYSNEDGVRRYYDTTWTAFCVHATRSTELLNFDPDNFLVSAVSITD